jgi:hypothetical protein
MLDQLFLPDLGRTGSESYCSIAEEINLEQMVDRFIGAVNAIRG